MTNATDKTATVASPLPGTQSPTSLPASAPRLNGTSLFKIGAVAGVAALAVIHPDQAWHAVTFTTENMIYMAPIIAISVLITAGIHATGLSGAIGRAFNRSMWVTLLAAAAIGAVTPICGVGVLPIIAGLLSAGVPLAPIMAFWLSSPITSPTMFAITLGTLGLPFAIGKTALAFAIGLLGGAACVAIARTGAFDNPLKTEELPTCCGGTDAVLWRFWRESDRRRTFIEQAREATVLIVKWLAIAFAIESVIRTHLPPDVVATLVGAGNAFAVELAVIVGAPIYLDGYASLPMVRGLVELGMTPGAAMALMIAGGIVSLYASVAVFALVRWPVFVAYIAIALIGAWASGHLYGWAVGVF